MYSDQWIYTHLKKLKCLNLYDMMPNSNSRLFFQYIVLLSQSKIVKFSSQARETFYLPRQLPALKELYQVVGEREPINAEMPELEHICFSFNKKTCRAMYLQSIANVIATCPKIKSMIFNFWDCGVAMLVDQNLRIHNRHKICIYVGYNSSQQQRKGPFGWKEQNCHWNWSTEFVQEFQTKVDALYWKITWDASLWPYDISWHMQRAMRNL